MGTLARAHQISVLLETSLEPDPRLKSIPYGLEYTQGNNEQAVLKLFFTRASIARSFVAPSSVPAGRLAELRQAFDATLHDPAFLDDAAKQKLRVVPIGGQHISNLIAQAYKTPRVIVERTIGAMGRTHWGCSAPRPARRSAQGILSCDVDHSTTSRLTARHAAKMID